jgi:hypothetical protein
MPCVVPAGVLAFVSRGPYGVAPVDLRQRLEAAIAPGGHLRATALVRGDAVTLAGETFEVLWPPADLLVDDHPFLARAVAGVRKLAAQIPELEENLTAVEAELRESLDPSGRRRDSIDHEQTTRDVDTEELGRPFEDSGNDGYDVPSVNDEEDGEYIDGPKPVNIPPELRDTFTKVYSDIRKANNDLSLILASRSGHLVCYGDADGPGLEQRPRISSAPASSCRLPPTTAPIAFRRSRGRRCASRRPASTTVTAGTCTETHPRTPTTASTSTIPVT